MEEKTKYEKTINKYKNSSVIVTILIITLVIIWFKNIIEASKSIEEFFFPKSIARDTIVIKESERIVSISPINTHKPVKSTNELKNQNIELISYSSKIENNEGKGIANIKIYCPNCIQKEVKTDLNGNFILNASFSNKDEFWKSTLTLSKDNKNDRETIDWREHQPQPIKF